jgi:hypothetical protein
VSSPSYTAQLAGADCKRFDGVCTCRALLNAKVEGDALQEASSLRHRWQVTLSLSDRSRSWYAGWSNDVAVFTCYCICFSRINNAAIWVVRRHRPLELLTSTMVTWPSVLCSSRSACSDDAHCALVVGLDTIDCTDSPVLLCSV